MGSICKKTPTNKRCFFVVVFLLFFFISHICKEPQTKMLNYKIDMLGGIFYQKDVFASLQTTRLFYFVRQKIVVRVYQYNILEV